MVSTGVTWNQSAGGGAGPAPTPVIGDVFNCLASVAVPNAVYLSSVDTVSKAFAGVVPTGDSIGVVVAKPTATTCRVVGKGLSGAVFVGLTTGATYYLSDAAAGGIVLTAPIGTGKKIQEMGIAASTTELYVDTDQASVEL